jgi:UDP-N-acetylmuramate: L-alanyl-gamma-D-glutamyl-meso-diaminopimelate ligase
MRPKHLHIAGIGGIVTSALAAELIRREYYVTGSDEYVLSPASQVLAECGLSVDDGYDASQVAGTVDLAVLGAGLKAENPVVSEIQRRGIRSISWPQLVAEQGLLAAHNGVVVGTNGKTTTSCLWTWILQQSGWDPDHVIGGKVAAWPTGVRLRGAAHCILEGDEYPSGMDDRRPKFVHYQPEVAILLNIHFDHSDVFQDDEEVMNLYRLLPSVVPDHGLLIYNHEDPRCREVAGNMRCKTLGLGLDDRAPIRLQRLDYEGDGVSFVLKGTKFHLPMWGHMNAWNAAAAALGAEYWGLPLGESAEALRHFPGAVERQERIRVDDEFILLTDPGYHPDAIGRLVSSLKAHYPARPAGIVLQPRYTVGPANWQQGLWPAALKGISKAIIMDTLNYVPGEGDHFSPERLCEDLRGQGIEASHAHDAAEASALFQRFAMPGEVWVASLAKWFPQPIDDIVKHARQIGLPALASP